MAKGRQHFTYECVSILSIWHTLNIWEYAMSMSVIYLLWLGTESCNSHIKVSHTCMDALLVHEMHRQKKISDHISFSMFNVQVCCCYCWHFFFCFVFVGKHSSAPPKSQNDSQHIHWHSRRFKRRKELKLEFFTNRRANANNQNRELTLWMAFNARKNGERMKKKNNNNNIMLNVVFKMEFMHLNFHKFYDMHSSIQIFEYSI